MGKPTDFYDDSNRQQMYVLDRLCSVPDFVKSAADEPKEAISSLPSTVFADPINRKFPCHTKTATWLANAYFQQNKHLYPKDRANAIQGSIEKFAEWFSVSQLVREFNARWTKAASVGSEKMADSEFALVLDDGQGHKLRRMPMNNPLSVKMAGEYLFANRHMYTYDMRKTAAVRILKKAFDADEGKLFKDAGVTYAPGELHFSPETLDYLERAAGCGTTHPRMAAEKIAQRMLMVSKHNPLHAKLAELAVEVGGLKSASRDQFTKLASVIDAVDRETGICDHYLEGVDMPEEMFFAVTEKQASDILGQFITLQTGNVIPIELLSSLPLEKVSEVLGPDFANAVKDGKSGVDPVKFAEIAPTLPRDEAVLLERVIHAATEKIARAYAGGKISFDKASMSQFFKERGCNVEDRDFTLTAKMKP